MNAPRKFVKRRRVIAIAAATAILGGTASACSSSASGGSAGSGGGSVTVGMSTSLSGSIAYLGQTGLQGVQLALADLNAKGGLLGKQVKLVSADDDIKPATGAANVRQMISSDHAVAIFGPVASSIASAEEPVAAQFKVPIFFHTSNDISLMTKTFTPYAFQNVPNTIMEPRAIADYLSKQIGSKQITIGIFAPDYSYGHDTVDGFLKALTDLHVDYKVVNQQFPALGATDISSNLSALINSHPDYVFNAQYGGDLVAFTKQAEQLGLFKDTKVISFYNWGVLRALKDQAPAGAIGYSRDAFWAIKAPGLDTFVANYQKKFNDYPSDWAILAYAAVQEWADGVTKARSFDADKVIKALPGATVSTIVGPMTIRACDHQAEVPEYIGTVSSTGEAQYGGAHLWDEPVFVAPFQDIALTCDQVKAMQP
ncbi:MAG: hypothetical protein EPN43_06855 [Jatrophihabitans sp.]|nr:MAG: hypothetical protein EPN43_06855 [Jatrophihabitans sp.]